MGKGRIQIRRFEAGVALAGLAAFGAIGPFRGAFAGAPGVLLLATLVLFLTPGTVLARWLWDEYFSGPALAPAAFVTSVGLFAISAVPRLILQSTMGTYLGVCASIVALSLLAAAVAAFRPERPFGKDPRFTLSDRGVILWAPFAALVAALAYIARTTAPRDFGDIWIYLSWVREYLGGTGSPPWSRSSAERLAPLVSRSTAGYSSRRGSQGYLA